MADQTSIAGASVGAAARYMNLKAVTRERRREQLKEDLEALKRD